MNYPSLSHWRKNKRYFGLAFLFLFAISMVSSYFAALPVLAVAPVTPDPEIDITQISDSEGNVYQAPFPEFDCDGNPLYGAITISGGGVGSAPPGQIDQYHIQVDWEAQTPDVEEAGSIDNGLGTFFPPTGQGNFQFIFTGGPHTYTSNGPQIIKARLYHSQPPGNDNQADDVAIMEICVIVEPECEPQDTQVCDTGESGICSAGTQTCDLEGYWGECIQDVQPSEEICDGEDNDCDGEVDEGDVCLTTYCGDDEIQTPNDDQIYEECDDGPDNGLVCDPLYGESCTYCSVDCTEVQVDGPYCGDEITNGDEECDDGPGNGVVCDPAYDSSCTYCSVDCTEVQVDGPYCGDGIQNGQEECDGTDGVPEGYTCNPLTCTLEIIDNQASICGYKFNDLNQNTEKDLEEPKLPGWLISLKEFIIESWTTTDSTTTDGEGNYCFNDLSSGEYRVEETLETDWFNSTDLFFDILLSPAEDIIRNFGNFQCIDEDNDTYSITDHPACGVLDCNDDPQNNGALAYPGNEEVCDGIDNDCDQEVDEGGVCECQGDEVQACDTGEFGICSAGTQTCQDGFWGDCVQNEEPVDEICDDIDNNCDGNIDEGGVCGDATYCGDGIKQSPNEEGVGGPEDDGYEACDGTDGIGDHQSCSQTCELVDLTYCGDGTIQEPNDEGTGGPENDGVEECDGEDGLIDNYYCSEQCTLELDWPECIPESIQGCDTEGVGICLPGTQTCDVEGYWGSCVQTEQSSDETCDGLDNDCDGLTDEGGVCGDGGGGGGGGGGTSLFYIHSERALDATTDTITISWYTNRPATSRVVYDTVSQPVVDYPPNYGYTFSTVLDSEKVLFHQVTISGLVPGTVYYFRPLSTASPEIYGEEVFDSTLGQPETPPTTPPSTPPTPPTTPPSTPPTPPEEGTVAGVEFEEGLAQNTEITPEPEAPTPELVEAPVDEEPEPEAPVATDCSTYIWLLLVLDLIAIVYIGYRERKSDQKWRKYLWLIGLILTLVPVIIWYPQCWLWVYLLIILILLIIATAIKEEQASGQPQS